MKSLEIRQQFLNFFEEKSHKIVDSAPIVLKDDPTLMFTNAGMNQFKEYFLGQREVTHSRIADTQKCLRVSGKHNDLEEVGMDTYHHTMFEMLGNWSFGDYFKKEAIEWAWEFLTDRLKIDKDSLYVSVFEGSTDADNLTMDQESFDLWSAIVPKDQIIMGNKKDNFWEMGTQGPCGPCSEIHIDIRSTEDKAKVSGRDLVNMDHPQVVEIWNLVFMQFNRKADTTLEKLPEQHVDTGMGFERLCMTMQNVQSNYDTDVFTPLIREIEIITKSKYDKNSIATEENGKVSVAIRVIADHVRTVSFSIADGQLPSNNGAGYVIRRILRRAIRYGFTFLNTKEPFIYKLVETLSNQLGDVFPELRSQQQLIVNVIKEEEHSFLKTLDQGLVLLDTIISKTTGTIVSGEKAFELYDTFGFPIDLTALILSEKGFELDEKGFDTELQKQKDRSRAAAKVTAGDWQILEKNSNGSFVGYDNTTAEVVLTRYRKVANKKEGQLFQLVFNQTPFYPEGGGQVGDKGYLESANGDVIYILDTKKENNLIIHITKNLPKNINAKYTVVIDSKHRSRSAANHTATHLLHQALRTILGKHIEQKGSMVQSNSLRFDFSHFTKVSSDELAEIENFVNTRIHEKLNLEENRNNTYNNAISEGAIALFGEKYGDTVRSIRFGESMELCGGIHVQNTADIWRFKITSEGAVASGIRRIEAISSDTVKQYYNEQDGLFTEVKNSLKNTKDPVKAITSLQDENTALKKKIEVLVKEKIKGLKSQLRKEITEVNGINFLATQIDMEAGALKDIAHELGNEIDNLFFFAGTEINGKALLTSYISKNLVEEKGLDAGKIVRELGKLIQGGGGGQKFFATAGGKNPAGLAEAISKAKDYIS
ncbi:alanine--tRNA ligase [Flavicella sp.]|uniref:alanine--tRNA ligase n=1 Tax=Flavicella sp. TaxID=2957742 RepID=UPI00301A85E9